MRSDPFSDLAGSYDSWFETPLGAFVDTQELTALRSVLEGLPCSSVLEVGAGTGHVSRALVSWGARVVALEPSGAMRSVGRERSRGLPIAWFAGLGESLPFADGSFDGVLLFATLEFVAEPARVLGEAFRVAVPGGWVAVGALGAASSWVARYRLEGDRGRQPWTVARFFAREELEALAGRPCDRVAEAVWLGPGAEPPFDEADRAGRRAGHPAGFLVALWRRGEENAPAGLERR